MTFFPFVQMYGEYLIKEKDNKIVLTITNRIRIKGFLSSLWKRFVAKNVVKNLEII